MKVHFLVSGLVSDLLIHKQESLKIGAKELAYLPGLTDLIIRWNPEQNIF